MPHVPGAEVVARRSPPHNLLVNEHTSEQAWKDHSVVGQIAPLSESPLVALNEQRDSGKILDIV